MKYNMSNMGHREFVPLRERTTDRLNDSGSRVVCDKCNGFFARRWFAGHRIRCVGDSCIEPKPVPLSVLFSSQNLPEDFKTEILSKFNQDEVGKMCQTDEMITMIGSKLYSKTKARQDKKTEVRRSVMTDMRRLATLFMHFKVVWEKRNPPESAVGQNVPDFVDMFRRRNYEILEEACNSYTSPDDEASDSKSGLMICLYYLLINAAKKIRVYYLVKENTVAATETAEFLEILAFNKHSLVGGAVYLNNKNRQTRLRRVQHLPKEEDLQKVREHTMSRIKFLIEDPFLHWTSSEFVELRDLVCSRLTLFNVRRGGEPARLRATDWQDACNGVWIDRSRQTEIPAEEKALMDDQSLIMYQTGKGINHLVPVIVPSDTIDALKKLNDQELRMSSGIREDNPYLFPSTLQSEGHVSGWHAISRVCQRAGVQEKMITATKMRHLTSTMYASLDIAEEKRSAFYKHMGHSRDINEHIYQAPVAEIELRQVGTVLRQFGK